MSDQDPKGTLIPPKQVRDLQENYDKIQQLEEELKEIKENYLSKDEFLKIMKARDEAAIEIYNKAKERK